MSFEGSQRLVRKAIKKNFDYENVALKTIELQGNG